MPSVFAIVGGCGGRKECEQPKQKAKFFVVVVAGRARSFFLVEGGGEKLVRVCVARRP